MKNFIKQFSLFEIFLTFTILAIHIYAATADAYTFPNFWFKRDDAYYYFKVAQNISEGFGSSFDKINLTNGYHPLWMIVCIPIFALARFDIILPLRILLIVIALMQITTAILLYRLIKKYLSNAVAILAASFWSFNFYIHATVYQMGLETPIAVLSLVYLIYKLSQFEETWRKEKITLKQISWLGFLSAMVMFSRLDLVFLAIIIGAWVMFRGTTIRYVLPLDILIIFISMTSAVILRTGFEAYNTIYASSAIEATVIAVIAKTLTLYFFGAYQHPRTNSIGKNFLNIFYASMFGSVIAGTIYILLLEVGVGENFPRSAFLLDFGMSLFLFTALRLTAYLFANPNIRLSDNSAFAQLKLNFNTWFREGLAFYGMLGGLLIGYMVFNHFIFGTSSPVSGQIKRWWGGMASSAYERPASNWASYFGIFSKHGFEAWQPFIEIFYEPANWLYWINPRGDFANRNFYLAIFLFIVIALALFLLNRKRNLRIATQLSLIPLLSGCGIHVLSYTSTAYGGAKEWYWVSQMILLTLVFSFIIDLILKSLQKNLYVRRALEVLFILISLNSAYQFWIPIQITMVHHVVPADKPYLDVIRYLEENTAPHEIIGMSGGGNVGYFIKDRTIVNMDGLINSYDYFHALQNGEAAVYLQAHGMTTVFASPRLLAIPPYFGQFAPYLERYNNYGGKDLMYLLEEPKY